MSKALGEPKIVKIRKPRQCFGCLRKFSVGAEMTRVAFTDGGAPTALTHAPYARPCLQNGTTTTKRTDTTKAMCVTLAQKIGKRCARKWKERGRWTVQEFKTDGELGLWEELNTDKMQERLNDGSASGYNVRKMTAEGMAHKNRSLQARRNANKRARKARSKSRRK